MERLGFQKLRADKPMSIIPSTEIQSRRDIGMLEFDGAVAIVQKLNVMSG